MFDDINYNVHQTKVRTFGIIHSVIKVQFTNFSIQCFRLIFLANCYSSIWISMINFFLTIMMRTCGRNYIILHLSTKQKKKKNLLENHLISMLFLLQLYAVLETLLVIDMIRYII